MSIPKIIHYCWFGGGPINPESRKCIESWKKYCPDYKIIEWNEQNFEISQNRYAQQAYEAKKYAFVSDYVRLAVLYEYGGIYLDTDVELVRPLDELLEHKALSAWSTVRPRLRPHAAGEYRLRRGRRAGLRDDRQNAGGLPQCRFYSGDRRAGSAHLHPAGYPAVYQGRFAAERRAAGTGRLSGAAHRLLFPL